MKILWRTFFKKCTLDTDKFPFGIRFYNAPMGGGKTLSMVNDTLELIKEYPDTRVFSNVRFLTEIENIQYFNNVEELVKCLNYATKFKHSIVLIDEALTYFAENGGIDPALMSSITQLRKNRIFILIAAQKFKRVNNRIRDFSLESVNCHSFWKFQFNVIRDDTQLIWDKNVMDFVGSKKYSILFKRNNELFDSYDTFQKIDITKNISNLFVQRGSPIPTLDIKDNKGVKING